MFFQTAERFVLRNASVRYPVHTPVQQIAFLLWGEVAVVGHTLIVIVRN